ncbi:melatonin receptor type 1B-B-like [Clytia hemisphaerica]|uniref:melatonin receptor type 1B-B-like n=1 Tax=Clytia hemisphaerica TaxID=252671 RepID=UPI0034D509A1
MLQMYRKINISSNNHQQNQTTSLPDNRFSNVENTHQDLSCYQNIYLEYNENTRKHLFVLGSLYILGSILAITFNLLFLIAMKRNRLLHKLSNYLLVCMSIFDLTGGLTVLPAGATILIGRGYYTKFCQLEQYTQSVGYTLVSMSFITIFTITLEQYIAICYPFFHQNNVKFRKLLVPMTTSWTLMAIACIICWHNSASWIYFQSIAGLIIIVTYITVVFCYTRLYLIATKMRRKITIGSRNSQENHRPTRRHTNKAIITSFSIIFAFSISYIPISIFSLKKMISKVTHFEQTVVYEWVQLIALYSSVVSPLVYYWRLREVRRELFKILRTSRVRVTGHRLTFEQTFGGAHDMTWVEENIHAMQSENATKRH